MKLNPSDDVLSLVYSEGHTHKNTSVDDRSTKLGKIVYHDIIHQCHAQRVTWLLMSAFFNLRINSIESTCVIHHSKVNWMLNPKMYYTMPWKRLVFEISTLKDSLMTSSIFLTHTFLAIYGSFAVSTENRFN